MLESLVASILNRVLGSYVENFDPKQLQIGLLSGDVKLGGLKLKQGALDQLQLPINVVEGHIGSLVLQIPYSNLKSKPVKVFLEDVFVVTTPDSGFDGTAQERRDLAAKLEKLQLWELTSERAMNRAQSAKVDDSEREKQQNFTSSLVTKIIENLQVTIRNIHIRLEDSTVGVAVGATLGELSAVSTNQDWEPAFIADVSSTTHKLATLDSLAFYIDPDLSAEFSEPSTFHSRQELLAEFKTLIFDSVGATDVLRPINGQGFITLNKNPVSELTPKIDADLKFEELSINLDREQYIDTLKLVDQFHKFFRNLKYRHQRPKESPSDNPIGWFKYAAETVLDGIHERNRRWTWEYLGQRLDDQKNYVSLYKKWYYAGGNVTGLSVPEKAAFERIQAKYSYEDIVFFRSLAKKALVSERNTMSAAVKKTANTQSWSEWLWGSKPNAQPESNEGVTMEADLTAPLEITEEQRRELLDVLDVTNLSEDSDAQILLSLQFSLRSAGVRLKAGGQSLASAGFDGVNTKFVNRPNSFVTEMSVDKFTVSDLTHRNQFSDIIRVQSLSKSSNATPFFSFLFEHHPADKKADSNLFLRSESVVLVHNARLMESVIQFFTAPPDQGDTVDAILTAANRTVEDLREQTRIGLEYALENHKTLNLQLDIKAPTIIIPLDPENDDSPVALLDVGSLEMNSELVSQSVLNEVKSKQALKYTTADWKRLESLMYDRFIIKLQDTQILLAQNMSQIESSLGESSSQYHFLDKTTLQFLLELSIVPQNRSLTRSRMSIKLPSLRATLADVQYILFMRILAAATPNTASAEEVTNQNQSEVASLNFGESASDINVFSSDETESVLSVSDAGTSSAAQRLFEFVFVVNEVRFFVVSGWDAKPLVDMCLHDFSVSCWAMSQPSVEALSIDVSVRDLLITDHVRSENPIEFRRIAESDGHHNETGSQKELFSVNYRKASSGAMKVKVNLEAMNFVLNADSVLVIYDYVMSTFTSPDTQNSPSNKSSQNSVSSQSQGEVEGSNEPQGAKPSAIEVELNLSKVSALLADDEKGIVTMSLSSAKLSVNLTDSIKMQFKLGAASIVDMNSEPVLSIEGENDLADFRYETMPMLDDGVTPSGPSLIFLRMGRVKFNILEAPLTGVVGFLMRFTTMKAAYDQSRMMAFNQSIQVEPGMFKFDLIISSPVISWYQHNDWIKVDLGEVFLQNEFEGSRNTLNAGIRHVEVTSALAAIEQQIVPETDLIMKLIHTPDSKQSDLPVTVIDASLSPVHIRATEYQYRFVMQFTEALSRISMGTASAGPDIEEVGKLRRKLAKEKHLEDKNASYWWGENFSVTIGGNTVVDERRPKLRLDFVAPSFDITLDLEQKPLARFGIQDVAVEADVNRLSELDANLHIRHFSADDLTGSELNKFPRIIPPIKHDGYQVMVKLNQRPQKPLNVECSVDSPQVILALEYLLLLRKYLEFGNLKDSSMVAETASEFESSDDDADSAFYHDDGGSSIASYDHGSLESSSDSAPTVLGTQSESKPSLTPNVTVNIVDMYLTVLSNEQDEDSEAIVFKIEQVLLSIGETSTFAVSKVGMFLTRMQSFDTSRLRILDDFSVTASVDNSESTENIRIANIQANMEKLILRISLREIGLILNILNKVSAVTSSGSPAKPRKVEYNKNKKSTNFFVDDHRVANTKKRSIENGSSTNTYEQQAGLVKESIVAARVLSEQLTAQFEDVRVIIIDPLHQLPLTDFCIKPFTLTAKNWSDSMVITGKAEMFVNVHSFTKSAWEPLVDNMEIGLTVTGDAVEISSDSVADLELTPETYELINDVQNYFADASSETFQRKFDTDGAPYRIVNETGIPITVWSETRGSDSTRYKIKPGQQISWSFHDWRELRENLNAIDQENRFSIEFHSDGYEDLRSIPANSVGEHLYVTDKNGDKVRIVVDIWIENHLKYISIRSTSVLRNHTDLTLEVLLRDANSQNRETLVLGAHCNQPLPLNFADSKLLIRRQGEQQWSNKELYWRNMNDKEKVTLKCVDNTYLTVIPETVDKKLSKHYPYLFINISVPFQIVNNLPFDVDLRLFSRDSRKELNRKMPKASRALIYDYNEDHLLLMRADIEGYSSTRFAVVNTGHQNKEYHREDSLAVKRGEQQELQIRIDYVDLPQGEGRVIVFFSPYVILNNTKHEFTVSGDMNKVRCPPESATLWSSSSLTSSSKHRITLTTKGSHYSTPISIDASGSVSEISLLSNDRRRELYLGVSIAPGTGRYVNTKVVTITPRFILCNSLDRTLEFKEPGGQNCIAAKASERVSVNFLWAMAGKEVCVRFADSDTAEWSSGFTMANVGKNYVRMIDRGKPTVLARVEVILEGATFFVHLTPAKGWPFSIRNFTDRDFMFYQTDPLVDEDGAYLLNHSKDEFTPLRYRLPPRSAMPYSWDFPAAEVKQLVIEPVERQQSDEPPALPSRPTGQSQSSAASFASSYVSSYSTGGSTMASSSISTPRQKPHRGGRKIRRRKVQLAEIGELPPANFGDDLIVDLSVIADGFQQALVIAPHDPEASTFDERTNEVKSEAVAEIEAVESQSSRVIRLKLKGIGISCVTPKAEELVYVTLRNISVNYHVSDALETIALQVEWIQVDNSLSVSSDFPVIIYPSVLPKNSAELSAHPCFSTSLTRVRDDSFGVSYIKHATLLLQEMTIEADEDFLLGVVELVVSLTTHRGITGFHNKPYTPIIDDNSVLCEGKIRVPEPNGDTMPDIYFEQLHLQPIQLNISFVRTGSLSSSVIFKDNNLAGNLAFIIDALTMTIGNVQDAPLRFNALLIDNVRTQMSNLAKMIQIHYQQEFLYQIHKILGSADIIGNPVGLFNNISSGVADLFYEPYRGYTLNDRPQEFGIGLAKGGLSFMKKSVYGLSDSFSKVTGSLSKGISAVTLDPRYQSERRNRRTRNRPRHAVYGFKYGFESLYESLSSGFMGLAEQPMQGAVTDGSSGFFRGLGMGLLGLPTKTTVGLLDMASNISEGIRNTTTVFDSQEIQRVRLPRVISQDGVIRPYNVRESVGQMILHTVRDNKYVDCHYLAHSNITRNKVVVVSLEVLLVASINDMAVEWSLSYNQVKSVVSEKTGISITLNNGAHGPFIPLGDDTNRSIIYGNIAKAVDAHNRRQLVESA